MGLVLVEGIHPLRCEERKFKFSLEGCPHLIPSHTLNGLSSKKDTYKKLKILVENG